MKIAIPITIALVVIICASFIYANTNIVDPVNENDLSANYVLGLKISALPNKDLAAQFLPGATIFTAISQTYIHPEYLPNPQLYPQKPPEEPYPEPAQPSEELRVILTPSHRTTLSSEVVVSTVQVVAKRMGDSFQQGDLLIQLDATVFKGLLLKATGLLKKAKINLTAKQELYQDNIASHFDIAAAQADLDAAQSDVISARHAVEQCTILAPYDGKVTNVYVEEHELVQQGKPLIEVINDTILIGRMLVPSYLFDKVSPDETLTISVRDANAIVTGKISRIDSAIDPASGMFKVDIEIDNRDRKLRSGMIGTTQLEGRRPAGSAMTSPQQQKDILAAVNLLSLINKHNLKTFHVKTRKALIFHILNDTVQVVRYDRAVLWSFEGDSPTILGVSGQSSFNPKREFGKVLGNVNQ